MLPHYYDDVENTLHLWPNLLTKAFFKLNQAKRDYSLTVVDEVGSEWQSRVKEKVCECQTEENSVHTNMYHRNYFVDLDLITMLTGWYGTEYKMNGLCKSEKWNTILGVHEQMKNNELVVLSLCINNNKQQKDEPMLVQMLDVRYYPFVEPERE